MDELFKRYKETGDIALRNQIAEKYLYIAEILANKFVGRGVEYDDLYQVAALALLDGIDRFDLDEGVKFTTFITPTIKGKIKNYFRDKSRLIKVPRRLGEISAAARKFSLEYEQEYGKKPALKTIAAALNVTEEETVRALEIGGTLSLDTMAGAADEDDGKSLYALISNGEDEYDEFETKETLKAAMRDFSQEEKLFIQYRYVDGLSQSDVAARLGVSQMSVSRLEKKLLKRLKERLGDVFGYGNKE